MQRRMFLQLGAGLAATSPALGLGVLAAVVTVPPPQLPAFYADQLLTVRDLNRMVERINELSERR